MQSSKVVPIREVEVIDSKYGFGRDPGDENPERVWNKDAYPSGDGRSSDESLAPDRFVDSPDGA